MKTWFSGKKKSNDNQKAIERVALLAQKEISEDLLSQIAGGNAKAGCHTMSVE